MFVPRITFVGIGSTISVENILGDVPHRKALRTARIALMGINSARLEESHIVVRKLMDSTGASDKITRHTQQKEALRDAGFVVMAFQIGGYEPRMVTDFEVCERHGLEQVIAGTLGPGGIMRTLHTTPHLWQIYEGMTEVYPGATVFNYVNPVAMNTRAMYARYPYVRQVGLCHLVQGAAEKLTCDLSIDPATPRHRCADINHVAFYLELKHETVDGSYVNLYPELLAAYEVGQAPKPNIHGNTRCQSIVRHEMFKKLGYFATKLLERFAEYTSWFIKLGREDLIERYKVSLDEYPKRCIEQLADWHKELEEYKNVSRIDIKSLRRYVSIIMNVTWTDEPSMIYGNVRSNGLINSLPQRCYVEVACLVDANGIQPTKVGTLSLHLAVLMQTSIDVQTLLTEAILTGSHDRVYYAAMMDPHTVVVLGIDETYALADDLIVAHGNWPPGWLYR